jgi:hypothetical protein
MIRLISAILFVFLLFIGLFSGASGSWLNSSSGLPTSGTFFGVTFDDVNNDGDLDVIAASDGNGVRVFLGDGAGNWSAVTFHPAENGGYGDVAVGDYDGDGNLDIFAGSPGNGHSSPKGLHVFKGDGTGGFTEITASSNLPTSGYWRGVAVGDVNSDGHLDLAATSGYGSSNGIHVYTGDGAGAFADESSGLPGNQDRDSNVELVDFDGDGDLDLAAGGAAGVSVFLGNGGSGGSMSWIESSSGLPDGRYTGVCAADVDGDGSPDLVLSSYEAGSGDGVRVYKNENNAVSWTSISSGLPDDGDYIDVSCGDFNVDGDMDILAAGSYSDTYGINVYYGNGAGSWNENSENLPSGNQHIGTDVADMNGDGRPDILLGMNRNDGIQVWSFIQGSAPPPPPDGNGDPNGPDDSDDSTEDGNPWLLIIIVLVVMVIIVFVILGKRSAKPQ